MSANNWAKCPKCTKQFTERRNTAIYKAKQSYGKVGVDTYTETLREAGAMPTEPDVNTLRENYELGTGSDGTFEISYNASCSGCGLDFTYKYAANILESPCD